MVRQRTAVLLVLSLVLAAGAAWVANNWLQIRSVPTANAEDGSRVMVAAIGIPYGQKIERQHLSSISMPKSGVPQNAFSKPEEVEGKVARTDILAGDIIRTERVVDHLEGSTLAAMIEESKRAVTVRVNDVVGVAGFLLPGNHVDVLSAKRDGKNSKTDTVLKNIKVLAVDQTSRGENDDKPVVVRAVTLEVTPPQAETLVKATEEGRIQLALRNPLDKIEVVEVAKKAEPEPEKKPVARKYSQHYRCDHYPRRRGLRHQSPNVMAKCRGKSGAITKTG